MRSLIVYFVSTICTCGCVANIINSTDVVNHMNSLIGRTYNPSIGWGHGWNKISENSKTLELEFVKSKNCSYSIEINKSNNIVESWRFTSPKEGCDNYYAPSL